MAFEANQSRKVIPKWYSLGGPSTAGKAGPPSFFISAILILPRSRACIGWLVERSTGWKGKLLADGFVWLRKLGAAQFLDGSAADTVSLVLNANSLSRHWDIVIGCLPTVAFWTDRGTILQAVILGIGIENDMVIFNAKGQGRVAALGVR
jgi:hypothetical protein